MILFCGGAGGTDLGKVKVPKNGGDLKNFSPAPAVSIEKADDADFSCSPYFEFYTAS